MAIVGILLIVLIMLGILMFMGIVLIVSLKLMGYEPQDVDEWMEEDYETRV
jgi:hypothetical protein